MQESLCYSQSPAKSRIRTSSFSLNQLKRAVCLALVFVLLLPMLPINLSLAFAEGNDHVVTYGDGQKQGFVKFSEAWDFANSKSGTIDMHADAFLGRRLTLSEGHKVTINMNGYMINRGKTDPDKIKTVHDSGGDGTIFYLEKNAKLTINGGTDEASKARTHKGRLISDVWYYDNSGSTVFNGALITGSGSDSYECAAFNVSDHAEVTIKDVNIAGNVSDDYSFVFGHTGGTGAVVKLLSNPAYHDAASNAKIHMENCTIYNNYARSNGAVISVGAHENAKIELIGCKIASNVTDGEGGVIYVSEKSNGASITLTKTWIHDNTAKKGAAIYIEAEGCTIEGGKFEFNHARENGGAIYLEGVENTVRGATIHKNDAKEKGGGVFIYQEDCTLSGCTITENTAGTNGGGVFLNTNNKLIVPKTHLGGTLTIAENTVKGNRNNLYLEPHNHLMYRTTQIMGVPDKDSNIWVTYGDGETGVISYVADSYNDAVFHSDNSNYNIYWGRDKSNSDEFRQLIIGKGQSQRIVLDTVTLNPNAGDFKLTKTNYNYAGWPVYKGYGREDSTTGIGAYYYSDGYFATDATDYNPHLATLSLRMAAAGYNSSVWSDTKNVSWDYMLQPIHVKQMLSDIGMADEDIYLSDSYFVKPEMDSIGCAIGSKKLTYARGAESDYVLVTIVVRGAGYEKEWASNVTIGSEGLHQGFNEAATKVVDTHLANYLELHPEINEKLSEGLVRFWVVGFSRAGATANLVCKKLIDKYQTYNGHHNAIYGYPLEAPQGGVDSEKQEGSDYTTIHNVVLPGDLVPNVAMAAMGFKRFGVDHYLPGTNASTPYSFSKPYYNKLTPDYAHTTDKVYMRDNKPYEVGDAQYEAQKQIMLRQLAASNPNRVFDDYFHLATVGTKSVFSRSPLTEFGSDKVTLESWLADFSYYLNRWLADGLRKAREYYVTTGEQATLRRTMEVLQGGGSMHFDRVKDRAVSWSFIPKAIWILLNNASDFDKFVSKLTDLCYDVGIFADDAIDMSTEEANALVRIAASVAWGDLTRVKNYQEGTVMNYGDDDEYVVMLPTLLYNADRILQNHMTDVVYAWLRSYDSYYLEDNEVSSHYYVGNRASAAEKPYLTYELNGEKKTLNAGETLTIESTDTLTNLALCNADENQGGLIFYNVKYGGGVPDKSDQYYSGTSVFGEKGKKITIPDNSAVIIAKTVWHDAPSETAMFSIIVKQVAFRNVYILKNGEDATNTESGYDYYTTVKEGDSFTVNRVPEEGWKIDSWQFYVPAMMGDHFYNIMNIAESVSEDNTTLQIKMPGTSFLHNVPHLYLVPAFEQKKVDDPEFSVTPGVYDHDIWVELSTPAGTEEQGFTIKYKLESHGPDYDGEYGAGDYESPLTLYGSEDGPVTWKLTAQAFHEGWLPSSEVTVEYTINYRNRVFNVEVIGGTLTDTGKSVGTFHTGDVVRITASNPEEVTFSVWSVSPDTVNIDNVNAADTSFTMPYHDVTVAASFEVLDVPTPIYVEDGEAYNESGEKITEALPGQCVYLLARNPQTDSNGDKTERFTSWTGPESVSFADASNEKTTFIMPLLGYPENGLHLKANFQKMYKITVNNGTARNAAGDIVTYTSEGEGITITPDAMDDPEHVFIRWEFETVPADGLDLAQQSISFEMPAQDVTATAIFQRMYKITVNNGTARNAAGNVVTYAAEGERITITADTTDSQERVFSRWEFDTIPAEGLNLTQQSISFEMPAQDVTATAIFQRMYKITVINGTATNAAGVVVTYAAEGERITITPNDTDNPEHIFSQWNFETVPTGVQDLTQRSLSFSMPGYEVKATAEFKGMFQINVIHGQAVNKDGQIVTYAAEGERITITPDTADNPERIFSKWDFDTVPVGVSDLAQRNLSFDMPGHDVMATAEFKYAIKVIHGHAEDAQGKTITAAFPGEKVILVPDAPPEGKLFDRWQVSPGLKTNASNRGKLLELILPVASADYFIALIGNELIMPESAVTAEAMYSTIPVIPQTGDNSMPVLWTLLGIGSILCLIYMQSKGRKKEMH